MCLELDPLLVCGWLVARAGAAAPLARGRLRLRSRLPVAPGGLVAARTRQLACRLQYRDRRRDLLDMSNFPVTTSAALVTFMGFGAAGNAAAFSTYHLPESLTLPVDRTHLCTHIPIPGSARRGALSHG